MNTGRSGANAFCPLVNASRSALFFRLPRSLAHGVFLQVNLGLYFIIRQIAGTETGNFIFSFISSSVISGCSQ
jgi:hypothetical protein